MFMLCCPWWHNGVVLRTSVSVSSVPSQQQGSGFDPQVDKGVFLCGEKFLTGLVTLNFP